MFVYAQAQGTTDHITVLCAAYSAGLTLPPFIIYLKSFLGGSYQFDGPDDALYGKSESGWIDSELFLAWLKIFFEAHRITMSCCSVLLASSHNSCTPATR